jgi:hypothetical protein
VKSVAGRPPAGLNLVTTLVALNVGVVAASLFVLGAQVPVQLQVVVLTLLTLLGVIGCRIGRSSFLPRYAILVYTLPFAPTLMYLVNPSFTWWLTPESIDLMRRPAVINVMMLTGVVGLAGLTAGLGLAATLRARAAPVQQFQVATPLSWPAFAILMAVALLLSWLSAPEGTVFTNTYAEIVGSARAERLGLNAAVFLSYALLLLAAVDAEVTEGGTRRLKQAVLTGTVLYIVIVFQLLRGDRESMALIAGFVGLYLTARPSQYATLKTRSQRRGLRLVLLAAPVFVLYAVVGLLRNLIAAPSVGGLNAAEFSVLSFLASSTAVLLTNLGIAAQHVSGSLDYLFGRTYIDYLISLPPGVLTHALGISRPLESTAGPAYWTEGISAGGIHIALVPFRNFGIGGTFVVLGGIGFAIGRLEQRVQTGGPTTRIFYAVIASMLIFWFWYGDMYIIRALMMAGVLAGVYHALSHAAVHARSARRAEKAQAHATV